MLTYTRIDDPETIFKFPISKYPDGTPKIQFPDVRFNTIIWNYESMAELFSLQCILDTAARMFPDVAYDLYLPYIPNARMDRCRKISDVCTATHFADALNRFKNISRVYVLDPHSSTSKDSIHNSMVVPIEHFHFIASFSEPSNRKAIYVYPDEGALKRYIPSPYPTSDTIVCKKVRDWDTGKINGLELDVSRIQPSSENYEWIVTIYDDICSYGNTFKEVARKLRKTYPANVHEIRLVVTHCEPAATYADGILNARIDVDDENSIYLIDKIITLDGLYSIRDSIEAEAESPRLEIHSAYKYMNSQVKALKLNEKVI